MITSLTQTGWRPNLAACASVSSHTRSDHIRQGKWMGAKVGIFAAGKGAASEMGKADYDWFRVE